jgi:hypothetical protein
MPTDRTKLQNVGLIGIAAGALLLAVTLWMYVRGTGSVIGILWSGWAFLFALSSQFREQPDGSRRHLLQKTASTVLWFPVKFIMVVFILSAVFYGLKPYLFASVKTGGIEQQQPIVTIPQPGVIP